jgi:hypothetical protein
LPIVPAAAGWPAAVAAVVSVVVGVGISVGVTGSGDIARTEYRAPVMAAESESLSREGSAVPLSRTGDSESESAAVSAWESDSESEPASVKPKQPPRKQPVAAAPSEAPAPVDTLAAEQVLLEQARKDLGSGKPTQARMRLVQHQVRFKNGQLVEEREALLVLALAKAGERAKAIEQAERFRARWPTSMHAGIVDAALGD